MVVLVLVLGDAEVLGEFLSAGPLVLVFDDRLVVFGAETFWDSDSVVFGGILARSQLSSLSSFSKSTVIVLLGACTSNTYDRKKTSSTSSPVQFCNCLSPWAITGHPSSMCSRLVTGKSRSLR